ncbi:MAG: hypothetical protein ACFFAS_20575 [Promethearchaeota archaeon]
MKCKKNHVRGKIYKDHLKFKGKKSNQKSIKKPINNKKIPVDKIIDYNYKQLRPVAQRQVDRLIKKLRDTDNLQLYTYQINKLIIQEQEKTK